MRETIQDKVNSWFIENRDPEKGEYPDFPDKDDGGSKVILNPPLPSIASLLEDNTDPKDKKKGGDKKEAKVGDDFSTKSAYVFLRFLRLKCLPLPLLSNFLCDVLICHILICVLPCPFFCQP